VAREHEAARHLFRVAAGLDSMVLGEAQILGQVRDAFDRAGAAHSIGRQFSRLFRLAIEVGKRARAETRIGRGLLSPSSVAVDLARRILGDLDSRSVLVIGAGDAARATLRSLAEAGVSRILVGNRSMQHAREVADAVGGQAIPYVDLVKGLTTADIVISSTGSTEHIISATQVRSAVERRDGRPLLCIDIAVPRDFDPKVALIPTVHLYNVDDLEAVSAANLDERQREVAAVEAIVNEGVEDYGAWMSAQQLVPTIGALYQQAEDIRRREMARTLRRMDGISDEQRDLIDAMTASIVRRLLHRPVAVLKSRREAPEAGDLARLVRELFALEAEAEMAR
jgi:glutamyl-tRNA reductase